MLIEDEYIFIVDKTCNRPFRQVKKETGESGLFWLMAATELLQMIDFPPQKLLVFMVETNSWLKLRISEKQFPKR